MLIDSVAVFPFALHSILPLNATGPVSPHHSWPPSCSIWSQSLLVLLLLNPLPSFVLKGPFLCHFFNVVSQGSFYHLSLFLFKWTLCFFKILLKLLILEPFPNNSLTTTHLLTLLPFPEHTESPSPHFSGNSSVASIKHIPHGVITLFAPVSLRDYTGLQGGASDFSISAFLMPGTGPGTW